MPFAPWFFCGLVSLALLPAGVAPVPPPASLAHQLRASRWRQRVLLIGAPSASQADFQQQKKVLATDPQGLAERDFNVIEVPYDQLSASDRQYWTQQLQQSLSHFVVVLIGKDGGIKRTETRPTTPASLFGTVDKMPMRRQEMRGKQQ